MTTHIYYRHTPIGRSSGKSRPSWFTHERCFLNLLNTIEADLLNGQAVIHFVFDGTENDMSNDFAAPHIAQHRLRNADHPHAIRVHRITGGDQRKAWRTVVALAREHCDNSIQPGDLIYFLENDYVHLPGWLNEVRGLSEQGVPWDYLTLYDHLDKYPNLCTHRVAKRYAGLRSSIYATSSRHWRTTPSTCATYLLSRETFLKDHALLRLGIYDHKLFRILGLVRRRRLLSPMPALATHSMDQFLSPVVDWAGPIGATEDTSHHPGTVD